MDSRRQAKFSRMIQRDMSEIFMREGENLFNRKFITVTNVRVSPDLGYVKVYLSFMNEKEPDVLLALIRLYTNELRSHLWNKIRKEVRKLPELEFYYDDTMDYVEKMDKIFTEIHQKPASANPREGEYKEDIEPTI